MLRLRRREWNVAKIDAKAVTTGVMIGAKDVRIGVTRGVAKKVSPRAPEAAPAQSSAIRLGGTERQSMMARNGIYPLRADVRFGSKADMCSARGHVRFTPESD